MGTLLVTSSFRMSSWPSRGGRGSRGRMSGSDGAMTEELLGTENQRMTDQLAGKVSMLKSLAFDIENETKDSNRYLNGMNSEFDSSTSFLSGSMNRIQTMIGSGKNNRKLMCYIILFLVGLFFVAYFLVSHITGGGT